MDLAVKDHVGIGLIGHDWVACLGAEGRAQREWSHSMDMGGERPCRDRPHWPRLGGVPRR